MVSCLINIIKYLPNIGLLLFLVIHYNVISPHFFGNSWSHINSSSLGRSSIRKDWFFATKDGDAAADSYLSLLFPCGCCGIMAHLGPDTLILCIFFTVVQMINLSHNGRNVMSPEVDSPIFFWFGSEVWYDIIWGLEMWREKSRTYETLKVLWIHFWCLLLFSSWK